MISVEALCVCKGSGRERVVSFSLPDKDRNKAYSKAAEKAQKLGMVVMKTKTKTIGEEK